MTLSGAAAAYHLNRTLIVKNADGLHTIWILATVYRILLLNFFIAK